MIFLAMEVHVAVSIIVPAIVAIGIFLAGLIITSSRANRAKIESLEKAVIELQLKIRPFWKTFEDKIADALHHPSQEHKKLDGLLEELKSGIITPERKTLLGEALRHMIDNSPTDTSEKAELLLKVMPMAKREAAGELPATDQRTIEMKKEAEQVNGATA